MDLVPPVPAQTAPQLQPVSPPPKPPTKIWVLIVSGVLLLGVGIVSGVLLGKQLYSTPQPQPIPTPLPPEASAKEGDPTANWKIYSDPNKVYEFKYPSNYSLGHYAGDSSPILLNKSIDWGITQHPAGGCKGDCPVITNKRDITINGYRATVYSGWVGSIGGETPQSFIKYEISEPRAGGIEGPNYFVITLWELDRTSSAQKNYSSTRNPGIINKVDQDTFDQILSTFKFLDQNQTYACPQTAWVNCMPGPNAPQNPQCSTDYYSWAKRNCPNFQGLAY